MELPRISLAAYAVQQNCVHLPQAIIEKHSSVDVTPILGVNHVKPVCYVMIECVCAYLLLFVTLHMKFVTDSVCMYYSIRINIE